MNRLFPSLFRRAVSLVLMLGAIALLQGFSPVLSSVQAGSVDHEGAYPYGKTNATRQFQDDHPQMENSRNNLKETADDVRENVREKLNLDQPLPQSTKDFLNDVQTKFEDTVEPITGEDHGFYQDNLSN